MKKPVFIIISVVVILVLLAAWVYLLFFNTPRTPDDNNFSNIGTVGGELGENPNQVSDEKPVVNVDRPSLRQLTTKPIAGFGEVDDLTGPELPFVYYVEMGTGHIYSINLETGEEVRISGTTIPNTESATISTDGNYVAVGRRSNTKAQSVSIAKINSDSDLVLIDFPKSIEQFTFSLDNIHLLYATREATGLVGYSYNLNTEVHQQIFSLPFHEATIQWGNSANDTHYVYPKTTYLLEGALYEIKSGKISRLPVAGNGLFSLASDDIIAYGVTEKRIQENYILNRETGNRKRNAFALLPEKCVFSFMKDILICALDENNNRSYEFPDTWYRGEISFRDSLWSINRSDVAFSLLSDIFRESSREVDVTDMEIGIAEKAVYFTNKNDNTLWMYEL